MGIRRLLSLEEFRNDWICCSHSLIILTHQNHCGKFPRVPKSIYQHIFNPRCVPHVESVVVGAEVTEPLFPAGFQ